MGLLNEPVFGHRLKTRHPAHDKANLLLEAKEQRPGSVVQVGARNPGTRKTDPAKKRMYVTGNTYLKNLQGEHMRFPYDSPELVPTN